MQTDVLHELLYSDDMDKNVNLVAKMQELMDQVSQSCDNYYLTVTKQHMENRTMNQPSLRMEKH